MNKDIPVGKKMTDKEKIAQIIAEHLCSQGKSHKRLYGSERMCYSRDNFAECEKVSKCVDALIAAGIGDTTNLIVENEVLQRDVDNLARTLEEGTEELQEVQHRAEVAERAFLILWKECKEKLGWNIDCTMWYAKQAEKELTEGKKQ